MSEREQQDPVGRTGKWMIIGGWALAIAILAFFFTELAERQRNPNRSVETRYVGESREVVLQSGRYGHYVASGKINGKDVTFFVDTGASYVGIPEKVANRIGLKKGPAYFTQTAAGSVKVYGTVLNQVSLGEITLYDVKASINPHRSDDEILLGMSFLRHLDVSHRDGQLTIRQ